MRQLDQLLRDGAGALAEAARAQIGHDCAENTHHVEARMTIKPQILGGDKGIFHMIGQAGQGDERAILAALEGADQFAVSIVYRAGLLHGGDLLDIQLLPGGHVKQKIPGDQRSGDCPQGDQQHIAQDVALGAALQLLQLPFILPIHAFFHLFQLAAHGVSLP